jgi:hypothetical protein
MPARTLAINAQRLTSEVFENSTGPYDFADAFWQGFTFLTRQQPAQLVAASKDLSPDFIENVAPQLRR